MANQKTLRDVFESSHPLANFVKEYVRRLIAVETHLGRIAVVAGLSQTTSQTKVRYLEHVVVTHQHVPGGKITMHNLHITHYCLRLFQHIEQ